MAHLVANSQFNYDLLELGQQSRNFYRSTSYNNIFEPLGPSSIRIEDQFWVEWRPNTTFYASLYAGTGISTFGNAITGGTVNAYVETYWSGASWVPLWGIYEIAVSASALYGASQTVARADEFSIFQSALNGPDYVQLSQADDLIRTFNGADLIIGYAGNDLIDAGAGLDAAQYRGRGNEYQLTFYEGSVDVADLAPDRDGTDALFNVERLVFADGTLALDTAGNAGQVYRLYQAAFARTPDNAGLKHNIGLVDGGLTLSQMSSAFLASAEFQQKYGASPTDTAYINALYRNVLGRDADPAGLAGWQARLNDGSWTRPTLLIGFSESPENISNVASAIANGIWLV
jgi:Ca2+-binding RTX toxin-like protein